MVWETISAGVHEWPFMAAQTDRARQYTFDRTSNIFLFAFVYRIFIILSLSIFLEKSYNQSQQKKAENRIKWGKKYICRAPSYSSGNTYRLNSAYRYARSKNSTILFHVWRLHSKIIITILYDCDWKYLRVKFCWRINMQYIHHGCSIENKNCARYAITKKNCAWMGIQCNVEYSPCVIGKQRPADPWRTCLFSNPRSYLLHPATRSGTQILIMFSWWPSSTMPRNFS